MGLKWTKPKKSKNGEWIITDATIPDKGEPYNKELWDLWRQKKEGIKADGFSLKKGGYYPGWKVTYFHKVTSDSMKKPNGGGGKMNWRIDYDEKIAKWKAAVERLKKAGGDEASDLPKDNRRVVKKNRENHDDWSSAGDDLALTPSDGGFSATGVSAEQLALELGDLDDGLELV